ncbi:MAG TPA: dienelactone hydrolase family protein [Acidobacteriaceae bacterium]|jgi:predicted esterase
MTAALDPHADREVHSTGVPLKEAKGAVVLLHGRGGSAEDILSLAGPLYAEGVAYLAPQAAGYTWYPNSFLAPREANEPFLSSALAKIGSVVASIEAAGISRDRIAIAGFSQGACLATEFVASNAARYAGVIAFTGGLIGPPDADLHHEGSLAGTPALFLSGDPDPHVPWQRVQASAAELERMGAVVMARRYPGRPHTITADELHLARTLIQDAFAQ